MRKVAYSKNATKALLKMPGNVSRLIRSKIEQYAGDPGSLANNIKPLTGLDDCLRLRVGDWRVVFSERGGVITIIKIAPRSGVYD